MKALWRMTWDAGRAGTLHGLFVAEDDDVKAAIGKEFYFGEVLGKHSEVYGELEERELKRLTDDPAFIAKFEEFGCESGYNPLDYLREEEDEETEGEES